MCSALGRSRRNCGAELPDQALRPRLAIDQRNANDCQRGGGSSHASVGLLIEVERARSTAEDSEGDIVRATWKRK